MVGVKSHGLKLPVDPPSIASIGNHRTEDREPHPGEVAGEASRSARHISEGAREVSALRSVAREAETGGALARSARVARIGGATGASSGSIGYLALGTWVAPLSGLGLAGGGIQFANGLKALRDGGPRKGFKDIIVGASFAAAGAAELTTLPKVAAAAAAPLRYVAIALSINGGNVGYRVAMPLASVSAAIRTGKVAAKGGPILAGGASFIDGAHDIFGGVNARNRKMVVFGALKSTGGVLLLGSVPVLDSGLGKPVAFAMAIGGTALIAGAAFAESWGAIKTFIYNLLSKKTLDDGHSEPVEGFPVGVPPKLPRHGKSGIIDVVDVDQLEQAHVRMDPPDSR